ncbi:hypothetical protein HUW62_30475 [Myxococcus sp. AM011]|uniref:hypothetical protein n=1 Tax=Myxococcus sp. AM011 TaxID=2745200 RepID=UPI001594E8FE|nr:hypothetical protein [Myxococcus sp. AM011]NVJ25561.1 hypothetical protein [Myxococcus sp. AM011]
MRPLHIVVALITFAACVVYSRPYWIFVSRTDTGVPRGFYLCGPHEGPAPSTRYCIVGMDGIILRDDRAPSGRIERIWYLNADGKTEYAREVISP